MNLFSKLFKRKENKTSKISSLLVTPGSMGVQWSGEDYTTIAKESYLKNIIAYRCIDEISKNVASVPWRIFKRLDNRKRKEINNHWLIDLINHPNPDDSFNFLILKAIAFLVMDGNSFMERVIIDGGRNKGVPQEIFIHRPDRVTIHVNPNTGQLSKYEYNVLGRSKYWEVDPITLQADLLHLKTFHPLDDWYGASTTKCTGREIDSSNESTEWNMKMLRNEGRPGMVVTVVGNVSEQEFESLERKLNDKYAGFENAGRNLLLCGEKGTEAKPYEWSPKEFDNLEGSRELARRIAMGYGVPPMLIGIPGSETYNNVREARMAFWETTIFYYLNYLRGELNNWFFPKGIKESDIFLDYVLDDVPALALKRDEIWARCQKSDFLTVNEKREMIGMPTLGPKGDIILVQAALIPLEYVGTNFTDIQNSVDEKKSIQDLIDLGYSKKEANQMIGES